jgi:hypothetical protein
MTDDEFRDGIWWVPMGDGRLRDACLSECATEIQRMRAMVDAARPIIATAERFRPDLPVNDAAKLRDLIDVWMVAARAPRRTT